MNYNGNGEASKLYMISSTKDDKNEYRTGKKIKTKLIKVKF